MTHLLALRKYAQQIRKNVGILPAQIEQNVPLVVENVFFKIHGKMVIESCEIGDDSPKVDWIYLADLNDYLEIDFFINDEGVGVDADR
jgi:hypothetical protein